MQEPMETRSKTKPDDRDPASPLCIGDASHEVAVKRARMFDILAPFNPVEALSRDVAYWREASDKERKRADGLAAENLRAMSSLRAKRMLTWPWRRDSSW
jgi:hypothetical protein